MQELKEFGLTDNEIKIYLALLKSGTSSPSETAEKTGFSRSYVYDALERLLGKAIVSFVLKNNKKQYTATEPKRFGELIKQRLEKIQKIIPKLEDLQQDSKEDIKVGLHKGDYVYKTLLKDIISTLKKDKEILIFGIDDAVLMRLDKHYKTNLEIYFSKLKKLGIKEKVIVKTNTAPLKEAKTTICRFLPSGISGNTSFQVYENKVAIFLWGNTNHLILIESKKVADSYRKQFELLWKIAKK